MTIIRPLFTSILHSSRTRCCNSHFARPLIPGRTFAAPSRSKPAPTKSAPSITLDALSPEFVKEADSVNRIFTFQPEVVKKFEASRFPKFLDEEVPFRETYGLLLRQSTIDLINQIGNSAESQPGKSFILDGPQGAGKSATLLQIVNHFALSDWLVFYVPNAAEWTSGKYPFQPYGTTALFEQQSLAAEYLQQIKAWNNNLLSKITAKQFRAQNVKLENPNLLQIVEAGIKNPKIATSAVETVLEEASKNTKIPVLVAVDQVNALFAFTNYHDKKSNRLTGRDLALSNSFSKIFGESPKSFKVVLFP
ncbi:mitochondrial ribosomal death-associated protein 3-domain-containing protein [Paraphysoderma sedebokerense]|nr:mitochondrial ribosomal death-associated protein 3-domain-containing protein [Paraphysoderma sedebokerense]